MTVTQQRLERYFPTEPWLERYGAALDADEELDESGEGWGVGWEGAMIFEITDVPLDGRTVEDLPDDLSSHVFDTVESFDNAELEALLETAPDDVRRSVESRTGSIRDRIVAELRETELVDATERLWPELREELPELLEELLEQLDENLTEDRTVYAWLDLHDGGCREVDVLEGRSERDHGFVLAGEYEQWQRLVTGDGNVVNMIMSGEIELDGDMQKLMQYTGAATDQVDIASDLDTRFIF